jgi:putative toxin-antitoxin system antitoxin component (TIGR02293 family)
MSSAQSSSNQQSIRKGKKAFSANRIINSIRFSPAWVVTHVNDAPGFQMELIDRIRVGVKKSEWKDFIAEIGATEKEFEYILPTSISSMQKKMLYDRETSERIYELARLFGLGYVVFDSISEFKQWLMTPSKALGNKQPFDLLDSSLGFEMVENEIIRIQHNVYA